MLAASLQLGGYFAGGSSDSSTMARARTALQAAVARARAFPGSHPENLKAELHGSDQKVSRRALFTLPPVSYVSAPTIDRRLCTAAEGCAQCVEACPHGALALDGDEVLVNRASCESCGVCVAACPQRAVEFPGWSPQELEAQVASLLETEADLGSRSVVFVCKSSSTEPDTSWLPVRVPGLSMVSVGVILGTLSRGASAVGLCPCAEDCQGGVSRTVEDRIDYCRQLLGMLGEPSEADRVMFVRSEDTAAPEGSSGSRKIPEEPVRLFGRGEVADVVEILAGQYGVTELELAHPQSPLGKVVIDEKVCTGCGTCGMVCPTGAMAFERRDDGIAVTFDASLCTGCRQCVSLCPEAAGGAISLTQATDLRCIAQGRRVLFQSEEARCERCGGAVASRPMLERIAAVLGDDYHPQFMEKLCVDCRAM
ncbi:MAG: 4Fe-4S binding protein [SAR202 cluster bacterium]|nr:4Fe-4S binding protein [SAR202 cluster bacterium]